MDKLNNLLRHLDKVKACGNGKYMACCPAHNDKSPSLSIKETEAGNILIHCFAGCEYTDVLDAIGLRPSDLFVDSLEPTGGMSTSKRRKYNDVYTTERLIVAIAKESLGNGESLTPEDAERALLASDRIKKIKGVLHG